VKKLVKDLELWEVDFLVAKAEGLEVITYGINPVMVQYKKPGITGWEEYSPTTNPSQAWPIIERELISVIYIDYYTKWMAESEKCSGFGETSLEAAMRCYIASKFGDEVDMDNLINK